MEKPDCNISCGESFARHGLISQRYFKEKFGVTAIKKAEDQDGEIVRICEMNGEDGNVSVELFGRKIETEVRHHEIKTIRGIAEARKKKFLLRKRASRESSQANSLF